MLSHLLFNIMYIMCNVYCSCNICLFIILIKLNDSNNKMCNGIEHKKLRKMAWILNNAILVRCCYFPLLTAVEENTRRRGNKRTMSNRFFLQYMLTSHPLSLWERNSYEKKSGNAEKHQVLLFHDIRRREQVLWVKTIIKGKNNLDAL